MEAATGYSAREAIGKEPVELFGWHSSELVRRAHFTMLKHTPDLGCVARGWWAP
jgi:hypothetical protein